MGFTLSRPPDITENKTLFKKGCKAGILKTKLSIVIA
jgi:hypothetical protein